MVQGVAFVGGGGGLGKCPVFQAAAFRVRGRGVHGPVVIGLLVGMQGRGRQAVTLSFPPPHSAHDSHAIGRQKGHSADRQLVI